MREIVYIVVSPNTDEETINPLINIFAQHFPINNNSNNAFISGLNYNINSVNRFPIGKNNIFYISVIYDRTEELDIFNKTIKSFTENKKNYKLWCDVIPYIDMKDNKINLRKINENRPEDWSLINFKNRNIDHSIFIGEADGKRPKFKLSV